MLVQIFQIVFFFVIVESKWVCTNEENLDQIVDSEIVNSIDCTMYNSDGCFANSTVCTCWTGFTGRKCDLLLEKPTNDYVKETYEYVKVATWLLLVLVSLLIIVLEVIVGYFTAMEEGCCCKIVFFVVSVLVTIITIYNILLFKEVSD